jgi:hypothetical protein
MAATNYAGGAQATTTLASMNTTVTSIQVAATTGWPSNSNPFVIKFDPGLATEEKCLISTYDGSGNLTIATRAYDGTTAYSHVQGATVQPCWDAVSAQDNNNHIYDPTRNDHTQYLTLTALDSGTNYHNQSSVHAFGAALGTPGTPTNVWSTSPSAGTSTAPARADHQHLGFPLPGGAGELPYSTGTAAGDVAWSTPGYATLDATSADISAVTPGAAESAGSVGYAADSGHVHGFLIGASTYVATGSATYTAAAGEATLVHGVSTSGYVNLPQLSTVAVGQVNVVINATPAAVIAVNPYAGDYMYGIGNNGAAGAVNLAAETAAQFCKVTASSGWIQIA